MKAVVIDDNKRFMEKLYVALNGSSERQKPLSLKIGQNESKEIDFEKDEPREIAQAIVDTYPELKKQDTSNDGYDRFCILINIEGRFGGAKRQEQKGVEIVLWLRCKHRVQSPIIVYSFQSNQQLLKKKPENLIINSEGCYHVCLPNDFTLLDKYLPGVSNLGRLKIFLKPAFDIEKLRHNIANWWGVTKLWNTHRIVTSKPAKSFPYPPAVNSRLSELNNSIAVFIYGDEDSSIGKVLQEKIELPSGTKVFTLESKKGWVENPVAEGSQHFNRIQYANSLRYQIGERKPKILQIDDEAESGWSQVFQHMIYGEEQPAHFRVISLNSQLAPNGGIDQKVEHIFSIIKSVISPSNGNQSFDPDLILLDVRLIPKYDEAQGDKIKEMSGAKLLQRIRQAYPGIPVIVTTASNKVWTYEEMTRLGADAYWIKEGLDEERTTEESVRNYTDLLELIVKATGEEYSLLRQMAKNVDRFRIGTSYWWLKPSTWKNGDQTQGVSNGAIIGILENIQNATRVYLHQSLMGYGYKSADIQSFWLRAIINQLAGIIEEIHFPGRPGFESNKVGGKWAFDKITQKWGWVKKNREDWIGQLILSTRNAASHHKLGSQLVDFEVVKITVKSLIRYLDSENFSQMTAPAFMNFNTEWNQIKETWKRFYQDNLTNNIVTSK